MFIRFHSGIKRHQQKKILSPDTSVQNKKKKGKALEKATFFGNDHKQTFTPHSNFLTNLQRTPKYIVSIYWDSLCCDDYDDNAMVLHTGYTNYDDDDVGGAPIVVVMVMMV